MRLLLFSDLHADERAARRIAERAGAFDALIGAGDFGNIRTLLKECIDALREITKPCILVAGNNESTEELTDACRGWEQARVLHGTGTQIDRVQFFGVGGGVPLSPHGPWGYDFTEPQAAGLLSPCPAGCVLVSHSPPKGVVDVASNGASAGSTAVRDAILRTRPRLVVCGHIHGSAGQHGELGKTPVVNAGPRGVEWDLSL